MKLRRLSKSHLLVLGAFLAAGAAALPALAIRAAADPDPTRFPGGPYFVIGCGVSHRNDDPIALAGKPGASHHHTFIGNRTVDASPPPRRWSAARRVARTSVTRRRTGCRRSSQAGARCAHLSAWVTTCVAPRDRTRLPCGARHDRGQPEREATAVALRRRLGLRRLRRAAQVGRGAELPRGPGTTPSRDVPRLLERPRPRQRRPQAAHGLRDERALPAHTPGRGADDSSSSFSTPRPSSAACCRRRAGSGACRLHERLEAGNARGAGGGAQLTRYNARPRGYSSAGRAPGSHPGGRRFEPA